MKKLMTIGVCAALAVASIHLKAATISVLPTDDLVAKVAEAASGDVITLAEGTYTVSEQIALSGKSDVTITGAGKDKTFVVVQDGVSSRHVSLSGMTNVKFEGISFRNAKLEYSASDATSTQGGSFRVENTVNLQIENCSFVSNTLQNTTVANAAVNLYGGALYVIDSDVHLQDSDFKENGILWTVTNDGNKECHGGVLYMSTPTGASDSALRVNLTATNCVFRSNFMGVERKNETNGAASGSYGGVFALFSVGADIFNCLFAGTYAPRGYLVRQPVWMPKSTGSYALFTQCTIADNATPNAFGSSAAATVQYPVLRRSVLSGHWNDIDITGTDPQVVLIDSVYTSGLAPAESVTRCGKTFASSNYVKCEPEGLLEHEGQVVAGSAAAKLDAGWRPASARTYCDWYVAADASASDENDGSAGSPFRTLKKAVSVVGDGDTIHLAAGTYAQSTGEAYPYDFTGKYGVTVVGAGRDATVLDGEGNSNKKTLFVLNRTHAFALKDLAITRMDPKPKDGISSLANPIDGTPLVLGMRSSARPVFRNLNICNNRLTAPQGYQAGVMVMTFSSPVVFDGCLLTNNVHCHHPFTSSDKGWMWHAKYSYLSLRRCDVRNNGWIPFFGYGTGPSQIKTGYHYSLLIHSEQSGKLLSGCANAESCIFVGNGCQYGKDQWGNEYAIKAGTTDHFIKVQTNDTPTFENCTFIGNSDGGKFFNFSFVGRDTGLYNCTFLDCCAALYAYVTSYGAYAKNTIFSQTDETDSTLASFKNHATFEADGVKLGKTVADLAFKDAANGDYHLTENSTLAIDTGMPRDWMTSASTDLDGNPRQVGYLKRRQPLPDIGCYELPRKPSGLMLMVW